MSLVLRYLNNKCMFKPGRKNNQFFRFLFSNHKQIFKEMMVAWQNQL